MFFCVHVCVFTVLTLHCGLCGPSSHLWFSSLNLWESWWWSHYLDKDKTTPYCITRTLCFHCDVTVCAHFIWYCHCASWAKQTFHTKCDTEATAVRFLLLVLVPLFGLHVTYFICTFPCKQNGSGTKQHKLIYWIFELKVCFNHLRVI